MLENEQRFRAAAHRQFLFFAIFLSHQRQKPQALGTVSCLQRGHHLIGKRLAISVSLLCVALGIKDNHTRIESAKARVVRDAVSQLFADLTLEPGTVFTPEVVAENRVVVDQALASLCTQPVHVPTETGVQRERSLAGIVVVLP